MNQRVPLLSAAIFSITALTAVFSVAAAGAVTNREASYPISDTMLSIAHTSAKVAEVTQTAVVGRVAGVTTVPKLTPTSHTIARHVVITTDATPSTSSLEGKIITSGDKLFYYLGYDDKRYFIPTPDAPNTPGGPDVVLTWYPDRTGAVVVTPDVRNSYHLGGNATVRPGTLLLKIDTSPKVYAVTAGGVFHWVQDALLPQLYGTNYTSRLAIVPDAYFINYTLGSDITSPTHPDGTLIQYAGSSDVYLVQNGMKRKFIGDAFVQNHFLTPYIVTNVNTSFVYPDGAPITGVESALVTMAGPLPTSTPTTEEHTMTTPTAPAPHDTTMFVPTTPSPTTPEPNQAPASTGDVFHSTAAALTGGKTDDVLHELKILRNEVQELQTENKYLKGLLHGVTTPTTDAQNTLRDFITYGVDANTKALGAGERAAVLNSYKTAFDKLPETQDELSDTIKIANGRWPTERSQTAEDQAKQSFEKIYGRAPDMTNIHDNAAVTIMAYGLRQQAKNRNLNSEAVGIATFTSIYGHAPHTTSDWNIVQAITYSGATR